MSTDSTELTFVRCPSCRSLVPAASTRCRMCGATLDATQKPEADDGEQKKSGRVRQRTMSQPENELTSAAGKIREDFDGNGADEPAPQGLEERVHEEEIDSSADPLSAYIEEVSAAGSAAVEKEPAAKPVEHKEAPARPAEHKVAEKHVEQSVSEANERDGVRKPEPVPGGAGDVKSKVIVESGQRKPARPSGLSFGKGRDEDGHKPQPTQQKQEQRQDRFQPRHEHHGDRRFGGQQQQQQQQQPRRDFQPSHKEEVTLRDKVEPRMEREERKYEPRPEGKKPETVSPAAVDAGRLFGWLVSYVNPRGSAIELREGKFFVSRSSLKSNDLVLDDGSVSTPHALVAVGGGDGLKVQDLMSERGVFLKRRSGDAYQRIADAVKVEHGDWLRFGDVEFLVALIGK